MHTYNHSEPQTAHSPIRGSTRGRSQWVFGGFAVIALFLLAIEHRAHLAGWLPWLILLACPLMHLLMHGGHGHRGHGEDSGSGDSK